MLKHRHYPMEKGLVRRDTLYTCSVCGKKIVVNYNSYCAMRVISGTLSLAVPTVISLYTLKNGKPGLYSPLVFLLTPPIRIITQWIYQKFYLKFEIIAKENNVCL
ncbi:MAG: hypothetical protein ACLTXW_14965 [Christensenellales bacterium]|jgi:hypothetical protein